MPLEFRQGPAPAEGAPQPKVRSHPQGEQLRGQQTDAPDQCVEAAGAISLSDAAAPSPARVSEIKGAIEAMDAACVFSAPQFETALVAAVTEGTDARTGGLDPLGADLPLGQDLYPTLLRNMRDSFVACPGA